MSKVSNKEILNVIRDSASLDYQDKVPASDGLNTPDILAVFDNYQAIANEFISTLVNKIGKTMIYSKAYNNPLKMLKKGLVPYGDTVEQLFVRMAEMKNFGEHWDSTGATEEADLIRTLKPQVTSLYISKNIDKKFKTSIINKDLRKAFLSEGGLSNLVQQIVTSITTKIEFNEFSLTKKTLNSLVEECKVIENKPASQGDTTIAIPAGKGKAVQQGPYCVGISSTSIAPELYAQEITVHIRTLAGKMAFMSNKYNLAKECTFSRKEDLVFITTPEMSAMLDVFVLANAFNVSSADIKTRIIEVDELPSGIFKKTTITDDSPEDFSNETSSVTLSKDSKRIIGILCDKDLLQIWDTYQGAGTFNNPERQSTNYFANREGIFATCLFANMCIIHN